MARPELAPGAPQRGMLLPRDEALPPVPLEHTEIGVDVAGPLAETVVVQRFRSAHAAPLDALYIFPLPVDAAVSELELRIGGRHIRGKVYERAEAESRFREAARRGAGAALLGQERPNLFSVELANLQPGEPVEVRLRFFAAVPFDDGWFTLSIPTVATPRYLPAGQPAGPRDGALPLLPEGEPGHTLALRVAIDAGHLVEIACPSHEIQIQEDRSRRVVTLRDPGAVPDRDVVLRYRPAGDSYAAAAFVYRAAGLPGTLMLTLTPRAVPAPAEVLPRELLFVFDRSGSMGGEAIAQARNALRSCLRALNPGDTFNIFPFDNHVERLAAAPLPFTQAGVDAADRFIATIDARGGTEIVGALHTALTQPRDPARLRVVVFLTDGAVGNEAEVLRELAGGLNEARVFAFGVGSAVNRFLLDKLAQVGRGSAEYILPGEPIGPAVERFQRRAALPLIRDLSVDWGAAQVSDALPEPLPDLYAGQPMLLVARFHGPRDQRAQVTIRGRTATGSFVEQLAVELPAATADRGGAWAALPKLWARARIAALEDAARLEPTRAAALDVEAQQLAIEHGLLSAHTSFVAIEEPAPGEERSPATARVVVPVHLPAGTRREAFEPTAPPALPAGALFAAAMPPMARGAVASPAGFLRRLTQREDVVEQVVPSFDMLAGPVTLAPTPTAAGGAAPRPEPGGAERCEAALRYLARTQAVDGSWADDERLTALAALAFGRAGHTGRAGPFRPQLARAAAWLAIRAAPGSLAALAVAVLNGAAPHPAPAEEAALAALHEARVERGLLASLQQLGGDLDGAVPAPGAVDRGHSPQTLALTAALALLLEATAQPA